MNTLASTGPAQHLLCMTLYNEPLAELLRSTESVGANLRDMSIASPSPVALAWVIDGLPHAAADVLTWLEKRGFAVDAASTERWQQQQVPLDMLSPDARRTLADGDRVVPVWLYLKAENRGKLDSHAVFFEILCEALQPDIVFQLDVGTTLGEHALARTLAHFRRMPALGALSSRCAAQAPGEDDGFVQAWQFFDTASQLVTAWPTEELCGQLSVIPGQYCALRWRALTQSAADGVTPLRRYLRGLSTTSRFERTMFLAEDRVIGQALTLGAGARWSLTYGSDVQATNDSCATLGELMRQRRRWNNGANACRLALLAHWPVALRRADRGMAGKLHFSAGAAWQAVQLLQQLLAPAAWLSGLWLLTLALRATWAHGHPLIAVATVVCTVLGWCGTLAGHRRLSCAAWSVTLVASLAALNMGGLSTADIALLVGPQVVTLATVAVLYPQQVGIVLRRGAEHLGCDAMMGLWLSAYSLCRLGDVSWGTKGLHGGQTSPRGWRNPALWALAGWGSLNAAAVYGAGMPRVAAGNELLLPGVLAWARCVSLWCTAAGPSVLLWRYAIDRRRAVAALPADRIPAWMQSGIALQAPPARPAGALAPKDT